MKSNLPGFDGSLESDDASLVSEVSKVLEALNRAERPILLAGNGIRLAKAEPEFREVAELLDIPVQTTWLAIDLIHEEHRLFAGRPGSVAPRGANFAVQNCDFLLAVGARLDRVVTGFAPENFARSAHKVMVDLRLRRTRKDG